MIWWTLGVAGVFLLLVLAVAVYTTTILVAREELDESTLGIAVASVAVTLAICYVMLLPLEVAVRRENSAMLVAAMEWVWPAALALCLFFVCSLIPFGMLWYESLDAADADEAGGPAGAQATVSPARKAALTTAILDFVLVSIFFLLWLAVGVVDVTSDEQDEKQVRVPLSAFLIALTTAVGWTIFFMFCGVGFAAVPIEGVRAFVNRPRPVSAAEYEINRARIHSATARLLESGRTLDAEIGGNNPSRSQRRRLAAFRQQVRELDTMHSDAEAAYQLGNTSVLRQYVMLILSVLASLLSTAWVLHIILYNLTHTTVFLNLVLVALDGVLPLLGSGAYAVMAFYLMWCTVFGCLTVGGNLLVFPVFPMRRGATMLNALLFNALLTLLAAMAALHLCATSFDVYAQKTNIAAVFAQYASGIAGVSQVVHYLPYALVVVSMVSVLWLLLCPKRSRVLAEDDSDEENPLI